MRVTKMIDLRPRFGEPLGGFRPRRWGCFSPKLKPQASLFETKESLGRIRQGLVRLEM